MSLLVEMFDGQVTTGDCASLTVTVKLHEGPATVILSTSTLAGALSAQLTVVMPTGKNEPDAGVQVTPAQLRLVVEKVTAAPH